MSKNSKNKRNRNSPVKSTTGMRQQGSSKSESPGKGESKNIGKNSNGTDHEKLPNNFETPGTKKSDSKPIQKKPITIDENEESNGSDHEKAQFSSQSKKESEEKGKKRKTSENSHRKIDLRRINRGRRESEEEEESESYHSDREKASPFKNNGTDHDKASPVSDHNINIMIVQGVWP